MLVRATSAEAYRLLVERGALPPARRAVYAALYKYGPCTTAELRRRAGAHGEDICRAAGEMERCNVGKRLGEMRDLGLTREVATRKCEITGMKAMVWDVTELSEPVPSRQRKVKPPTMRERIEIAEELRESLKSVFGDPPWSPPLQRLLNWLEGAA